MSFWPDGALAQITRAALGSILAGGGARWLADEQPAPSAYSSVANRGARLISG